MTNPVNNNVSKIEFRNGVTIEDCDDDFFNQVTSDFEKKTEEKIQLGKEESKEESNTTFKPDIPKMTEKEMMDMMLKWVIESKDPKVMLKNEIEFKIELYKKDFNVYKKNEIEFAKMINLEGVNVESPLKSVFSHFEIEIKNVSNRALMAVCLIAMTGVMAQNESLIMIYSEKCAKELYLSFEKLYDKNKDLISLIQKVSPKECSVILNSQILTVTSSEDKKVYKELFMNHFDSVVKEFNQDIDVQNREKDLMNIVAMTSKLLENLNSKGYFQDVNSNSSTIEDVD